METTEIKCGDQVYVYECSDSVPREFDPKYFDQLAEVISDPEYPCDRETGEDLPPDVTLQFPDGEVFLEIRCEDLHLA